ncbi:hypothetical protein Tco_0420870 [Tanacetum coccineum]
MSDQLAEEKNTVKIKQTKILELEECLRKKESENEHLKSKVVDFTTVQNLQVQVEKLKSVNESLNLSVEELSKARALAEATLRKRDELISDECKKMRLLEDNLSYFMSSTIETKNLELVKEMGDKVKRFDDEEKVFENKISKMEKLASQNYTTLEKENNDLRTSYNVLKEKHETSCEKLKKQNNDLKMHYKSLFDSIKQKKVVSQVFTKSIPKVNVSEKVYTGKSSKPISRKVSQFTTYSLQKDRKYLKKQHSSKTFASQNHVTNKSSKQAWKRKENIFKRLKYSRDEIFSMCKRDDSVFTKVKDVRFPFISKRIFQNETPSFNNKWKSSSYSRVKTSNETPGFKTVLIPLKTFKTPNETSRFYKSKWTNEKSFKSLLVPRKLFQNETSGFKSPWNLTSMHQVDVTYIWFSKYDKPVSNVLKWVPKVVV